MAGGQAQQAAETWERPLTMGNCWVGLRRCVWPGYDRKQDASLARLPAEIWWALASKLDIEQWLGSFWLLPELRLFSVALEMGNNQNIWGLPFLGEIKQTPCIPVSSD